MHLLLLGHLSQDTAYTSVRIPISVNEPLPGHSFLGSVTCGLEDSLETTFQQFLF